MFKKYLGFLASPVTLFFIVGLGVIIGICGLIWGFGTIYDFFAQLWSMGAMIFLIPLAVILLVYAWLINPLKALIAWLKTMRK